MSPSHFELTIELATLFDELDIDYVLGGSLASSLVGEPRSTVDVDVALHLTLDQLPELLDRVDGSFYVPAEAAKRAVVEKDSFNLIHNDAVMKVDLFVLGDDVLDRNQMARRVRIELPTESAVAIWVTSTEDQILRKLDWYRRGGETSDRQWRDVVAILRINGDSIAMDYVRDTARQIGLIDLVEAAVAAVD